MASLFAPLASRAPLVVSVAAHVAVVAAAGWGGLGHGAAPARAAETEFTIDLTPPVERQVDPLQDSHAHEHDHRTFQPHTHPYALPPGHDDTPHDPSIDHRHTAMTPATMPVAAAPSALTASDDAIPHFTLAVGSAETTNGGAVAANGHADHGAATLAPLAHSEHAVEYTAPMVTVPARLLSSVRPDYPEEERAAGTEADVGLEIVVDAGGTVVTSRVVRHAGRSFDDAALRAIGHYRFSPAQYQGDAVRVRMPWLVSFRLE